jgi:hypothetical protein
MSRLNTVPNSAGIIDGFLVNLTKPLNASQYTTRYRNFYLGPVKALDGDMTYTSTGITLMHVASETRVICIVQHADNEPEPGTLRALRRSKILFKEEFTRGSGNFFPDPLTETLLVVSREQDMNCAPRRLLSPKGKLVSQIEGSNIVIDRGNFPGDACVRLVPATDDTFIGVKNNTSYYHVVSENNLQDLILKELRMPMWNHEEAKNHAGLTRDLMLSFTLE